MNEIGQKRYYESRLLCERSYMDILITSGWLKEHGLTLPDKDLAELAKAAQDELEMRAGGILMEMLTPEQVEAFGKIYDEGDEDKAIAWLSGAVPDYKMTVKRESTKMRRQLEAAKDKAALIQSWSAQRTQD